MFDPDSDWLDLVKLNIRARMEGYEEDQIEFSILSLVRDPLPGLVNELAVNIKQLQKIERAITSRERENTGVGPGVMAENTLLEPDVSYEVTAKSINEAAVPAGKEYSEYSTDELEQHRRDLSRLQMELRATIREEQQLQQADDDYAAGRRYDYGPAIRTWLRFLARKRFVEDLIPRLKE